MRFSLTGVQTGKKDRRPSFWVRKWRGLVWRLVHDANYLVLAAEPLPLPPPLPPNVHLLRLSDPENAASELARTAMRAVDEPDVVRERLVRGQLFFGWSNGDAVVGFGWATKLGRVIGLRACRESSERVFLYNFATLPGWRGQGLYPALLQQIRYALGQDGATEFVIDVQTANLTSLRGSIKAGFLPVACAAYRTVLLHWHMDLGHVELLGSERPVW